MTTAIFDLMSHADFLRLTLEAFGKQGYAVEPSRIADADAVLVGKNGARIGILCKKYRSALIGRPVMQQFHSAMLQLRCTDGYLISTTEGSPEARDFAAGKRIVLYNLERTTALLRKAFGDEFIRTGRLPAVGATSRTDSPAARQKVTTASYEKVAAADLKKAFEPPKPTKPIEALKPALAPEPVRTPEPVQAPELAELVQAPEPIQTPEVAQEPEPIQTPELEQASEPVHAPEPAQTPESAHAPELVQAPEPVPASEPVRTPEPVVASELVHAPEPTRAPEPEKTPEPEQAPVMDTVKEKPHEEVRKEQGGSPDTSEEAPPKNTTIIVCMECNMQQRVPIDQGMITVTCPECGMRRIYQPELNSAGELVTKAVISCKNCSQQLNVPTNRGQLKVRCPQCKTAWVFTP